MADHLDQIREWDKRIGVPGFPGWEEREIKAACNNPTGCACKQFNNGHPRTDCMYWDDRTK